MMSERILYSRLQIDLVVCLRFHLHCSSCLYDAAITPFSVQNWKQSRYGACFQLQTFMYTFDRTTSNLH